MADQTLLHDVLMPGEYSPVTLHVPGTTPLHALSTEQLHIIGRVVGKGHKLAAVEVLELLMRRASKPLPDALQMLADCLREAKAINGDLRYYVYGPAK
jgi:hypothetical protein